MVGPYKCCGLVNQDVFVDHLLVKKVAKFEKLIECLLVRNVLFNSVKEGQVI